MNIGKILILAGATILIMGIVVYFTGDKFNWFGKLPLDFSYKSENSSFYAPIGSMIIVSIIVSVFINIYFKIFK